MLEGVELVTAAGPGPAALIARTEKLYAVPLVRPVTAADTAVAPSAITRLPGVTVTWYPVTAELADTAAVQFSLTWPLPGQADSPVGAAGASAPELLIRVQPC